MKKQLLTLLIAVFCNAASAQFTTLHDFVVGLDGKEPLSTFYSDGTFLYATTYSGGFYNRGTIFKIKPDGAAYTILHEFNDTTGNQPRGSFISDGTFLYGMTVVGGINGA